MRSREIESMRFKCEHEMAQVVEQWLCSQGLLVKREFSTPWGICDLVGLAPKKRKVLQRVRLRQTKSIGPPQRIAILQRIPDRSTGRAVKKETVYRKFSGLMSQERFAYHIDKLIKGHFVRCTCRGTLQKLNGWMPLSERIVAVELKLSRIGEVLRQAAAHREIADETLVALPDHAALRASSSSWVREFQHLGVGILAVSAKSAKVAFLPQTKRRGTSSVLRTHCVERFWPMCIRDM